MSLKFLLWNWALLYGFISNRNFLVPNYLKIDVDGIEYKIISSGKNLFLDKNLKSVLIEINSNREEDKEFIELLKSFGFFIT